MLTCVCRPVSNNLSKFSPNVLPTTRRNAVIGVSPSATAANLVVTAEPRLNVPGRLTSAELRAMALRQQQQIDSQHQLLATKEQRLRFLKSQEVRNAVASAEGERLRRLRERVEAQESKLRRLRALRGQVDLQKTYNVTLSNDLDSIRALFSEKEKELSLAVAKVEALTRQLEDLRRDRRCPLNLLTGSSGAAQQLPPQASRELEKLRRELIYRNQLTLQQDARLHLQREALQQRQAELRSVDQRIYELQTRLQRKKAANIQTTAAAQAQSHQIQIQQQLLHSQQQQQQHQQHQHQQNQHHLQQQSQHQQQQILQQQKQQQQPQQQASPQSFKTDINLMAYQNNNSNNNNSSKNNNNSKVNNNHTSAQSVAALKQQLLQKQQPINKQQQQLQQQLQQQQQHQQQQQQQTAKFSNIVTREQSRNIVRSGNVAAVEPYIHTPQKSTITSTAAYLGAGNLLKHAAATANTNQQNQLIQDLTHVKLNLTHSNAHIVTNNIQNQNQNHNQNQHFFSGAESDESKLAKKMLTATITASAKAAEQQQQLQQQQQQKEPEKENIQHIYAEVGPKKRDIERLRTVAAPAAAAANIENFNNSNNCNQSNNYNNNNDGQFVTNAATVPNSKIPKSIMVGTQASSLNAKTAKSSNGLSAIDNISLAITSATTITKDIVEQNDKQIDAAVTSETLSEKNTQQLTVHSTPLGTANKSVATGIPTTRAHSPALPMPSSATSDKSSLLVKPKPLQQLPSGNLVVPPRKPISSVAPTSVTSSIPKMITYSPKVNRVAPNVVTSTNTTAGNAGNASASNADRPALPPKPSKLSPSGEGTSPSGCATESSKKSSISNNETPTISSLAIQTLSINDNLPIKAKPLTIRKQPMSEQPRLRSNTTGTKLPQQITRKIELPTASAFLLGDLDKNKGLNNKDSDGNGISSIASIVDIENHVAAATVIETPPQSSPNAQNSPTSIASSSVDEPDKIDGSASETSPDSLKRRTRSNTSSNPVGGASKPKLTRRVSFDPLALLLDASLEGELELVKKTAMQVANPSAANDEGITALHNAICAGHIDIVKFLVGFGCDVNAQDSDGWTPLHCAASCNNLSMVKFLVENGACLFASTLSDHETPAEKCEEDEEGFDGCSEYLYSIQEKLGILHGGEVYAVFSYEAQNSDELTFNVNERLIILRKGDDAESEWWWAKNENNEEGYVPRNLLGLYPRVPPQNSNFND